MIQVSPTDDTKLFNRVGSGDVNWTYYVVMERENPMLEIINVYRLAKTTEDCTVRNMASTVLHFPILYFQCRWARPSSVSRLLCCLEAPSIDGCADC